MADEPLPPLQTIISRLVAARPEFPAIPKRRTGRSGPKEYLYADIADILDAVVPVLAKHGLVVMQPTRIVDGMIVIDTELHAIDDGTVLTSEYPVCSLNGDHKAMGAAMTYARRYALTSFLGIAADEDTDGEGAARVDERQISNRPDDRREQPTAAEMAAAVRSTGALLSRVAGCNSVAECETLWKTLDFRQAFSNLPHDDYRGQIIEALRARKAVILDAERDHAPDEPGNSSHALEDAGGPGPYDD